MNVIYYRDGDTYSINSQFVSNYANLCPNSQNFVVDVNNLASDNLFFHSIRSPSSVLVYISGQTSDFTSLHLKLIFNVLNKLQHVNSEILLLLKQFLAQGPSCQTLPFHFTSLERFLQIDFSELRRFYFSSVFYNDFLLQKFGCNQRENLYLHRLLKLREMEFRSVSVQKKFVQKALGVEMLNVDQIYDLKVEYGSQKVVQFERDEYMVQFKRIGPISVLVMHKAFVSLDVIKALLMRENEIMQAIVLRNDYLTTKTKTVYRNLRVWEFGDVNALQAESEGEIEE